MNSWVVYFVNHFFFSFSPRPIYRGEIWGGDKLWTKNWGKFSISGSCKIGQNFQSTSRYFGISKFTYIVYHCMYQNKIEENVLSIF